MPVASPPVLIDTADTAFIQDRGTILGTPTIGAAQDRELFNVGGNLYAVLTDPFGAIPSISVVIRVFKSTDGGLTWASKDIANEPGAAGININNFEGVFLQGTKIYVAWRFKPGGPLTTVSRLNVFDTITDTWQGQSVDSPTPFGTAAPSGLAVLSNTDQYILSVFSGADNLRYLKFSAAVWGVALIDISPVAASTSAFYKAHLVDASDTIHLVYAEQVTAVSMNLYYVQISATGVVGIRTLLVAGGAAEVFNVGNMCFQGTNVVIPFFRTSNNVTTVLIGTPLAAPVFTPVIVDPGASTVPVGQSALFAPCAVLDGAGNINVFWGTGSAGDLDDRVWTAVQSGPGTFAAPLTWYSQALFSIPSPPQDPASTFPLTLGSPTLLPGSNFGMLWDAVTLSAEGSAAFLLLGAGGPGPGPAGVLTLKFAGEKIYG
jgi:hypothetical protein